ncbi:MAG TPA: hypothetical protein DEQ47_19280 [Solibacterales bacterium]|nr:hypothetical protein [Bryobacterales bacterium]
MKQRGFSLIIDDDDRCEAADVVGIAETDDHIEGEFWYCKFAMADEPGHRIEELYQVCGQAQKSIRWLEKPRELFTHLMRREPRKLKGKECTRYERGGETDLLRISRKRIASKSDLAFLWCSLDCRRPRRLQNRGCPSFRMG